MLSSVFVVVCVCLSVCPPIHDCTRIALVSAAKVMHCIQCCLVFCSSLVCLPGCAKYLMKFWRGGRSPMNSWLDFGVDRDPLPYFAPVLHPRNAFSVVAPPVSAEVCTVPCVHTCRWPCHNRLKSVEAILISGPGFGHLENPPDGFFGVKPVEKYQAKNQHQTVQPAHTFNSVCCVSNN